MPAGTNGGAQLNLLLFEVVLLTTDPTTGKTLATTLGLHPLVVVPSQLRYTDASRSTVSQTDGGSLLTRAGRGLRALSLSGTFGVQDRGLGNYFGTGEVRFRRFVNEVVRLPDARTRAQVDACIDPVTGTKGLAEKLRAWDRERSSFGLNFWDFWKGTSYECQIGAWNDSIEHRNGGATGNRPYSMTVGEVGPLLTGTPASSLISDLFGGLTVWRNVNAAIGSYDIQALGAAALGVPDLVATQLLGSIQAVEAGFGAVTVLMGASAPQARSALGVRGTSGIGVAFLRAAKDLERDATAVANDIANRSGPLDATPGGQIAWTNLDGVGDLDALTRYNALCDLRELTANALWEQSAGVLFGMSREDYVSFLTSSGSGNLPGPTTRGSLPHIVTDTDTGATIEAMYGVPWGDVLASNNLTPDEALVSGVSLAIPRQRARGVQSLIRGLPTFGSHLGQAAWGVDLALEQDVNADGSPRAVSGPDILQQGVDVVVEQFSDGILRDANDTPDVVQARYLAERYKAVLLADPRVASVDSFDATLDAQSAAYVLAVSLTAINGGSIRAGDAAL